MRTQLLDELTDSGYIGKVEAGLSRKHATMQERGVAGTTWCRSREVRLLRWLHHNFSKRSKTKRTHLEHGNANLTFTVDMWI